METHLAPLVVVLVTLLVIAFLLVSYYRVILASCWFLGMNSPSSSSSNSNPVMNTSSSSAAAAAAAAGAAAPMVVRSGDCLSGSVIDRIPIYEFSSLELESDCAVCLVEFQPQDCVKLLPGCNHGFHPGCIDEWLSLHSSFCPLCRSKVEAPPSSTPEAEVHASLHLVVLESTDATDHEKRSTIASRWRYLRRARSASSNTAAAPEQLRRELASSSSSGNGTPSSSASTAGLLQVEVELDASIVNDSSSSSNVNLHGARTAFWRMRRSLSSSLVLPFRQRSADTNPVSQA